MNNPYTSRGPISDASMFFGRTHELQEIGSFLRGNQSVSIVGPRKIGKSSLMLHLMRPETVSALRMERNHLFVYIDCQSLNNCRPEEVFAQFCIETAAALSAREIEPEVSLDEATSTPTRVSFEGALRRLNERGLRIVFMLDEFEGIALNPHVDVNLFNALRSAAGRLHLAFVTASAQPLFDLTYSGSARTLLSSPFFNIFAQIHLGLLPESDARSLIRAPVEAAGTTANVRLEDFIYQLVGGYPLGLQIACYHAWENQVDLAEIEQRTTQELEAHFEYYWRHLSADERDVLHHLRKAGLSNTGDPAVRSFLRDLTQKCLLLPVGGSYIYPSRAWAEFVATRSSDLVATAPTEATGARDSSNTRTVDRTSSSGEENRAHVRSSGRRQSGVFQVFRESLPEMLGGLGVAVVLGIAGIIYTRLSVVLQTVERLLTHYGLVMLAFAVLSIIAIGIVGGRMMQERKQRRLLAKQSGDHPLEIADGHSRPRD